MATEDKAVTPKAQAVAKKAAKPAVKKKARKPAVKKKAGRPAVKKKIGRPAVKKKAARPAVKKKAVKKAVRKKAVKKAVKKTVKKAAAPAVKKRATRKNAQSTFSPVRSRCKTATRSWGRLSVAPTRRVTRLRPHYRANCLPLPSTMFNISVSTANWWM